jgi:hypothetical protein
MRSKPWEHFLTTQGARGVCLVTIQADQKGLDRQVNSQQLGKLKIIFIATDHQDDHEQDIPWELKTNEAQEHIKANWRVPSCKPTRSELIVRGARDRKPFKTYKGFITSLRTNRITLMLQARSQIFRAGGGYLTTISNYFRFEGNDSSVMETLHSISMKMIRLAQAAYAGGQTGRDRALAMAKL